MNIQRITQHKRACSDENQGSCLTCLLSAQAGGTHPNPALLGAGVEILRLSFEISQELFRSVAEMIKKCWASFMPQPLSAIEKKPTNEEVEFQR